MVAIRPYESATVRDLRGILIAFYNTTMSQDEQSFSDVFDAANRLSPAEQRNLIHILGHRLAEQERIGVIQEAHEADAEFDEGKTTRISPDDLCREISS